MSSPESPVTGSHRGQPRWSALTVDRDQPRYKWVALSNTTLGC
jgi:hypothetical protein